MRGILIIYIEHRLEHPHSLRTRAIAEEHINHFPSSPRVPGVSWTGPTEEQVRCVAPWDCTHACSPLIMPLFALVPQWVGLTLSRVCAILLTTCVRWCRHCS